MTHSLTAITVSGSFPIETGGLTAPANFNAVGGDTVANLSWDSVTDATDYEVRVDAGSWISTSNATTYQFTSLTNDQSYTFDVRATNVSEDGPASTDTATPILAEYISLVSPEYTLDEDFEGVVSPQIGGAYTAVIDDTTGSGAGKVNKARYYPDGVQGGVGSVEGLWSETTVDLPIQAKQVVMQWDEYVPTNFDTADLANCKSVMIYSGTYGVANSNMTMNCECWPATGGGALNLNAGQDGINYGHSQNPDNYLLWEDNQGSWQHITVYFEVADDASSLGRLVVMRDNLVMLDTDNLSWAPLGWVTSTYGYTTMQELIRFSTRGNFVDKLKLNGWFNTDVDDVFGGSEMAFLQNNIEIQASTTKGAVNGLPTA